MPTRPPTLVGHLLCLFLWVVVRSSPARAVILAPRWETVVCLWACNHTAVSPFAIT